MTRSKRSNGDLCRHRSSKSQSQSQCQKYITVETYDKFIHIVNRKGFVAVFGEFNQLLAKIDNNGYLYIDTDQKTFQCLAALASGEGCKLKKDNSYRRLVKLARLVNT